MHVCVSFFIVRFVLFKDENDAAVSKEILYVTIELIMRTRSKSFKDALNGLIHWILVDSNMLQFKMCPKQDHIASMPLRHFSICQFQYVVTNLQ